MAPSGDWFSYDLRDAPLIRLTYPREVTLEIVPHAFAFFTEVAKEFGRVAWVIDTQGFNPLSAGATIRRAFSDHFNRDRHLIEPATVAEAIVHDSDLVRGLITAVDWMSRRKMNTKFFATSAEGEHWARQCLEQEGPAASATLAQLRSVRESLQHLALRPEAPA